MNHFLHSVQKVFQNAGQAVRKYPAVVICAFILTVTALIRVYLDFDVQMRYELILSSISYASAFGAAFGLAATTWATSRKGTRKAFQTANMITIVVALLIFAVLYFLSDVPQDVIFGSPSADPVIHPLAIMRTMVGIFLGVLWFVLFAAYPAEESDFSRSLTMSIKAFFQALLYGLVIFAGASAVAGAVQGLLYPEMDEKIYGYIAVISAFIAFTVFLGYIPVLWKGKPDPRREEAQRQPRFFAVLLEFILVPIMLALTVVLLLWASRTMLQGMDTNFVRLYSISTGFAVFGILLHILVTHSEAGIARMYRRVFPFAALLILAFEAWALVTQIMRFGIKETEYLFGIVWIAALAAALLLIIRKNRSHSLIVAVITALSLFIVLPGVGVWDLPRNTQLDRLQKLLTEQGMFRDNQIVPAQEEPPKEVRRAITESVDYLSSLTYSNFPSWFDRTLVVEDGFDKVMGFARTYEGDQFEPGDKDTYFSLSLKNQLIDISGYQWSLAQADFYENNSYEFQGKRGEYVIKFATPESKSTPKLIITLNSEVILEEDYMAFMQGLVAKYSGGAGEGKMIPLEDMSLKEDLPELNVLIVFQNIESIGSGPKGEFMGNIAAVYLSEKP